MFGYVVPNQAALSDEAQKRYRTAYCGLCHELKGRFGQACRFSLTYDMAFLALLLGSLYEPKELNEEEHCIAHPFKPHPYLVTDITGYAADLSIALAYHKCLDDWNYDLSVPARAYARMLERAYHNVRKRLPRQCVAIEEGLADIARIEQMPDAPPDAAANRFGDIMGELFVRQPDLWEDALRNFGGQLGRFIYFMDAACDLEHDQRKGSYNPIASLDMSKHDIDTALATFAGRAAAQFEKLPLEQDLHLLRSVLYSGVWQKRNAQERKRRKHTTHSAEQSRQTKKDA